MRAHLIAVLSLATLCFGEWTEEKKLNDRPNLLQTSTPPNKATKVKYIILANPHDGDKELAAYLKSNDQIKNPIQLFNFKDSNRTWEFFEERMDGFFKCSCPRSYDSATKSCLPYYDSFDTCKNKVGFIWYAGEGMHSHPQGLSEYLHSNFVRVITMSRSNCLGKYIAATRAQTGENSITVDKDVVAGFCNRYKVAATELKALAKLAHHHINVNYDELVDPAMRNSVLADVNEFMMLQSPISSKSLKAAKEIESRIKDQRVPASKYVSNWQDIFQSFVGTDMEYLLGTTLVPEPKFN